MEIIVIIAIVAKFIKNIDFIWDHNITGSINILIQIKITVRPLIKIAKVIMKNDST